MFSDTIDMLLSTAINTSNLHSFVCCGGGEDESIIEQM